MTHNYFRPHPSKLIRKVARIFEFVHNFSGDKDGAVVTVIRLRAGRSGVRIPTRARVFSPKPSRPALGPTLNPIRRCRGSFPG